MGALPTGTVTFLFTDIEGSTHLWEDHTADMELAQERHDEIMHQVIDAGEGHVFSIAGDAFVAAFAGVAEAVDAAVALQAAIAVEPWPEVTPIRVRIGVHTGECQERDGDYFGPALNRAARICAAGHGGQVVVSDVSARLVEGHELVDLGEHRLKDLSEPQRLWQVGDGSFPPLRSIGGLAAHNLPVLTTELLGRDDDLRRVLDAIDGARLVTLTGMGGTGKTSLVLRAAAELVEFWPDGVWFVDLAAISDRDEQRWRLRKRPESV